MSVVGHVLQDANDLVLGYVEGVHVVYVDVIGVDSVASSVHCSPKAYLEQVKHLPVLQVLVPLTISVIRITTRIAVPCAAPEATVQPVWEITILWLDCAEIEVANNCLASVLLCVSVAGGA